MIFSIDCCLEHGLITTTSDDRSVKIWKTNFTDKNDWRKCTVASSKSMFGHTARIFQHKIIVHGEIITNYARWLYPIISHNLTT